MLSILANRAFRHLFLAQISALTGTGLLTVALGLLAYDFAGEDGAFVLGLIFTVKMVAYVTLAPVAAAFANRVPRRAFLASLDIVRALTVVVFPFVSEVWQVFVLVFLLQAASAAFTPTFQATIPDVLPDEGDYTRGLSLSRLAYDLESISSPLLAFLILLTLPYEALFVIAVLGFIVSAAFVLTTRLSTPVSSDTQGVWDRTTRGVRIFLKTPRLRGLLCLDLAVAAAGAMVLVNSISIVIYGLDGSESAVALTLGAFGLGSMIAALALPRMLESRPDRPVMLTAGVSLPGTFAVIAVVLLVAGLSWPLVLVGWFALGLGYSLVLTPAGRLLRRSVEAPDRPAIFAAQFALSHACFLVTYPVAGWLQSTGGTLASLVGLGSIATVGITAAFVVWPGESVTPGHEG